MAAGLRISRQTATAIISIAAVATAGFLLACGSTPNSSQQRAPGFYNFTGWNDWTADINGEVGNRLYVNGPRALCHPSRSWRADKRIVSGELPPGLNFASGDDIQGIPTQRGHWIVNLETYNVECQGNNYKGFTQELRFHITGSGRVVQ
jgi:hypothetical protein